MSETGFNSLVFELGGRVFKWSTLAQQILSLALFSEAMAVDRICIQELLSQGGKAAVTLSLDDAKAEFDARLESQVKSIFSPDDLAGFFLDIGGVNPNNYSDLVFLANRFFTYRGLDGVRGIVRNLLLNHRHKAQEEIRALLLDPEILSTEKKVFERYFQSSLEIETFRNLTILGNQLTSHEEFLDKLSVALEDFIEFSSSSLQKIPREAAFRDVISDFMGLRSPSIVGQFMELFLSADRVTKQYIFGQVVQYNYTSKNELYLMLRGTLEQWRTPPTVIESLVSQGLDLLQEKAYFEYVAADRYLRPALPSAETTTPVALRMLARVGYGLINRDTRYAKEVLAKDPNRDPKVDQAMEKVFNQGRVATEHQSQPEKIFYASYELLALERNVKGLSSLKLDFKYSAWALSNAGGPWMQYLADLLEFHSEFDLRRFPVLKDLAIAYFQQNPKYLDDLGEHSSAHVQKFRRDFKL